MLFSRESHDLKVNMQVTQTCWGESDVTQQQHWNKRFVFYTHNESEKRDNRMKWYTWYGLYINIGWLCFNTTALSPMMLILNYIRIMCLSDLGTEFRCGAENDKEGEKNERMNGRHYFSFLKWSNNDVVLQKTSTLHGTVSADTNNVCFTFVFQVVDQTFTLPLAPCTWSECHHQSPKNLHQFPKAM